MGTIKRFYIVSFAVLLVLPMALTVAFRDSSVHLGGVTRKSGAVPLSLHSVLDGSFQRSFENRFSRRLSLFGTFVKTDNQLSLWIFGQVSSNPKSKVVMGNEGHLIERAYLPAFNRQGIPKRSKLASVANQLVALERNLAKRKKGFLLLISTNKPSFYPHLVPSWFRVKGAQDNPSAHQIFLEILQKKGFEPLDSPGVLRRVANDDATPLFSPTGTHWNEFGACKVASELGRRVQLQLEKPMPRLVCSAQGERARPTNQDLDLLQVTNLLYPNSLIRPVPRVVSRLEGLGPDVFKPKLLLVGTSFCWELLQVLKRNPVFSQSEFLYYFQRQILSNGKQRSINKDRFDILAAIERSDVVVLEVNEAFVHRAGYGFIERALKALREPRAKPFIQ